MSDPTKNSQYRWLSRQPPVLVHVLSTRLQEFSWNLPQDRIFRLVSFSYPMPPEQIIEAQSALSRSRPNDVVHWLCNTPRVAAALQRAGIPHAHFVSRYAWLNDAPLHPIKAEKQYDAIYVARMHPGKRHELAALVSSCLFVGGETAWDPQGWQAQVKQLCPHATFAGSIPHSEVPKLISSARVGLCLSFAEGTQRAFAEYQLCGLPAVSTTTPGGRNELFDPEFCRLVAAEPLSVNEAVMELAAEKFNPTEIRAACFAKINHHRERLCDIVQEIWDVAHLSREFRQIFCSAPRAFRSRPVEWIMSAVAEDVPWQCES